MALKPNTKKAYSAHEKSLINISTCLLINISKPLTENEICLVAIVFCRTHKITTLAAFISGISHFHLVHGFGILPRGYTYANVMKGLHNFYAADNRSIPKTALTLSNLKTFHSWINWSSFEGVRDWCMFLFAFFGLLRVGEYCDGALRVKDVKLFIWGIELVIPFSKTSLHPSLIDLAARGDFLCPVLAFKRLLYFRNHSALNGDSAFFTQSAASIIPLTEAAFITRLRFLVRSALGVDPSSYAGHSFRRGGTSALALAGVPESAIALHGRWSSLAYRRYFDIQNNAEVRLIATVSLRNFGNIPQPALSS